MRLGKYLEILNQNIPKLEFDAKANPNNATLSRIEDISKLVIAAQALSDIPSIRVYAYNLISAIPTPNKGSSLQVHNSTLEDINRKLQSLTAVANQLRDTLENTVAKFDNNTIYFKVPDGLDLEDLSDTILKIDTSFKQILGVVSPSTAIRFKGFDSGSCWLVLGIAGNAVIILKALDYAMDIATKALNLKKQYLETEILDIDLQLKRDQLKIHEAQIKAVTEKHSKELLSSREKDESASGDDLQRIANALTELRELMQRGANIEVPLIDGDNSPDITASIALNSAQLNQTPKELLAAPQRTTDIN